jgi:hypothetical protein
MVPMVLMLVPVLLVPVPVPVCVPTLMLVVAGL